jgi:hypothetical protein
MHDELMIPCETFAKYTDTNERHCRPSIRGAWLIVELRLEVDASSLPPFFQFNVCAIREV